MSVREDGGLAFPGKRREPTSLGAMRSHVDVEYPGMTLRDWFAGQAVGGIVRDRKAKGYATEGVEAAEWMAAQAYGVADAMLAERSKP